MTLKADSILDWKPNLKDGELIFERRDFFRGKPKIIKAKKGEGLFRVLLFGESVAAGFPLAPAFTPTTILEDMLRSRVDEPTLIEVIDLSAPAMAPSDQLRVCEAAAQLQPDVCVFMQGLAWYLGLALEATFPAPDRVRESAVLRTGGLRGSRERYLRELASQAKVMAETLADLSHSMGAQSVFVISGYNHQWERRTPPPILGGEQTNTWFELFEQSQSALMAGDDQKALQIAAAMKALEGIPLSSTPERIEAKVFQARGLWSKATAAATAATDASCWHSHSWSMPQHHSWVCDAMYKAAPRHNTPVVDLRKVFADHWQTPFLDYRMYYDHVHFTVEGAQVALTAVANTIVKLPKSPAVGWNEKPFVLPSPPSLLKASALFQGAFWISQFCPPLLKDDLESLLCEQLRPLTQDKNMLLVLKDFLKTRTLDCSPALHPAMVQASKIPGISTVLGGKRLNRALCHSIFTVLNEVGDGDADIILNDLIESYQARLLEGVDISQAFFRDWYWEFSAIAFNDSQQRQGSPFYKAFWPASTFSFFADGTTALRLEIQARIPIGTDRVEIEVNGTSEGFVDLSTRWEERTLVLKSISRGLNTVAIKWPKLGPDDAALSQLIEAFGQGRDADIFRVHGDIYSLRVIAV